MSGTLSTLTPSGHAVSSPAGVIHWCGVPSEIHGVFPPCRWSVARLSAKHSAGFGLTYVHIGLRAASSTVLVIGSGEVYGYRMDAKMPPAVRAGVTPKRHADRDIGAWNTFEITMRGDRLTVVLNGEEVISNAQLPGVPPRGPIALQHHGAKKGGVWVSPPSLVQFRNIAIKEL